VKAHALARTGWSPQPGRQDPIAILAAQAATRLPELLPLRYERMRASPFAFLRGSAAVMAADLATLPGPGPLVQLCGDAHLANFGAYASPEGNPVFDVNDFDETLAGPFDWDLRRLATSLVVSGREHALPAKQCRNLAKRAARHYRKHLKRLAGLPPLEAWHSTIDLRAAIADIDPHGLRRRLEKRLRAVLDSAIEHYDLVTSDGAGPAIADQGNTRHLPAHAATIRAAFTAYPETLQPQFADLLVRYRLVDCAFKVVGIGSVGTFCAIGLFTSADGAPLLLQLKEAQTSCLEGPTGAPPRTLQGERVVTGQRRLQAQSDIFLGWTATPIHGRDFYVRRLKDSRLARIGDTIEADLLPFTAALCGRTLARAHGRAGDAARLSAAIAPADDHHAFDNAIADFACAYADQTAMDHAAFCRALDDGTLPTPASPTAEKH
jgi:uncharacterized protein (DUF2252 family)